MFWTILSLALLGLGLMSAALLYLRSALRIDRPLSGPRYRAAPFLPERVAAVRWSIGEAEAVVVTRGPQAPGTPSVIYVPGFAEDARLGLLSLSEWMAAAPSFRAVLLNKRGYAPCFYAEDIRREPFPGDFEDQDPGFPISADAAVVQALLAVDPCGAAALWGHSQGGATVQLAVSRPDGRGGRLIDEDIIARVRGVVLEASVLPGGRLDHFISGPFDRALTQMGFELAPLLHQLDVLVAGAVRRRLRRSLLADRSVRRRCLDQGLYRFKRPRVALDNSESLMAFQRERRGAGLLRDLAARGLLSGLFPARKDWVLDARTNARIMRAAFEGSGFEDRLVIVDHTHWVALENPALARAALDALFGEDQRPSAARTPTASSQLGRSSRSKLRAPSNKARKASGA